MAADFDRPAVVVPDLGMAAAAAAAAAVRQISQRLRFPRSFDFFFAWLRPSIFPLTFCRWSMMAAAAAAVAAAARSLVRESPVNGCAPSERDEEITP